MRTLVPPGVYAPQEDTDLLAGALRDEPLPDGAAVLDVGTGSGALAIEAARRRGTRVTAVDVSWRAVCTAQLNARLARLQVHIRHGNLFAPVHGQSFDLILANPPYVPAPDTSHVPRGAARSWDAGRDGRLVLDRICREAPALLRPGGVLLVVHSAFSCPERTLTHLRGAGLKAFVTRRRMIPVLRSRERWLRELGLMATADQREELVVVRAELPPDGPRRIGT